MWYFDSWPIPSSDINYIQTVHNYWENPHRNWLRKLGVKLGKLHQLHRIHSSSGICQNINEWAQENAPHTTLIISTKMRQLLRYDKLCVYEKKKNQMEMKIAFLGIVFEVSFFRSMKLIGLGLITIKWLWYDLSIS